MDDSDAHLGKCSGPVTNINAGVIDDVHSDNAKPRSSKAFHRKSRVGCVKCRSRRVKCDEVRPCCSNCERRGDLCIYDRPRTSNRTRGATSQSNSPNQNNDSDVDEPEESADRRMFELRLLHLYITRTGPSIPFELQSSHDLFVEAVPRMAFNSKALLYSMFAITALHQTKLQYNDSIQSPDKDQAQYQHKLYLQLAFRYHRQELNQLSQANVDILFTTASVMRLLASAGLSERELEPYTAPIEWLRISRSHQQLYKTAWDMVKSDSTAQVAKMAPASIAFWQRNSGVGTYKGFQLDLVLDTCTGSMDIDDDPSTWNTDAMEAYTSTVTYIKNTLESIKERESFGVIARNIMLFPVMVPELIISHVELHRSRALVILAHYFTLLDQLRDFWYVDNAGSREVGAIAKYLPPEWKFAMEWPLETIKAGKIIL